MTAVENMAGVKETIRQASGTPIKLPGAHPKYKEAYSESVWTLIEQVIEDHDRVERHAASLTDAMKLVLNQQQNNMADLKRLSREIGDVSQAFKALPAMKATAKAKVAEEGNLKGE